MHMLPKIPKATWLLFFILTVILTMLFSGVESPADGNDAIVFPFPFYRHLGGRHYPEPTDRTYLRHISSTEPYRLFRDLVCLNLCYKEV